MLGLVNKLWNAIGYNMYKDTFLMKLITAFLFIVLITTVILGLMVPILEEINTNTLADAFEIVGPYYQVIVKILLTNLSIKVIRHHLSIMGTHFWHFGKFGKTLEKDLYKIIKFATKYLKMFIITAYCCCTVLCVRPLFLKTRKYPLSVYNIVDINDNNYYLLMYCLQLSNFIFGATVLLAIDGLYMVFITNVYCQLKMIKYAFLSLRIDMIKSAKDEEICYEKLKEYINHHAMILKFIRELTNNYSIQILNQFIGNSASICMGIYIVSISGVNEYSAAFKASTIIAVFTLELVLFCTAGTLITETALDIGEAIYASNWQVLPNKRIQFAVQMIIMRTHKLEVLQAGKMVDINLSGLTKILKTSVSFYTLMNNVDHQHS